MIACRAKHCKSAASVVLVLVCLCAAALNNQRHARSTALLRTKLDSLAAARHELPSGENCPRLEHIMSTAAKDRWKTWLCEDCSCGCAVKMEQDTTPRCVKTSQAAQYSSSGTAHRSAPSALPTANRSSSIIPHKRVETHQPNVTCTTEEGVMIGVTLAHWLVACNALAEMR